MWTNAKLSKRKTAEGRFNITIVYVNDDGRTVFDSFDAQPGMTDTSISSQAIGRLAQLNGQETAFGSITEGSVNVTPPPPPPPPTDKEIAQRKFLVDYFAFQRLQRGVTAGLIAPDDKLVANAQAALIAEFLPEYVSIL